MATFPFHVEKKANIPQISKNPAKWPIGHQPVQTSVKPSYVYKIKKNPFTDRENMVVNPYPVYMQDKLPQHARKVC